MAAKAKPRKVEKTEEYESWFTRLRDINAQARINARIDRVVVGNFGDTKSVGGGVLELRITYGPGYRVYLMLRGDTLVLLLCGGDKSTQSNDIAEAKSLAKGVREDDKRKKDGDNNAVG